MSAGSRDVQGLEVRLLAVGILRRIFEKRITIDEAMEAEAGLTGLQSRDRSFVHTLLLTTFRRLGEIEAILKRHLDRPLPRKSGPAMYILYLGVTQLVFLGTPAHAAIDLAVRTAKADRNATHFSGVVNAVLRKVAVDGKSELDGVATASCNTPAWLWQRWVRQFGEGPATEIARAHLVEPAIDVTVRSDGLLWAERLQGVLLPNGSIRLPAEHAAIAELPGFADGAWWVQDVAAALPVSLLGDVAGKSVLDLCSAPGGKTLQLAAAGATVTSVDVSGLRLRRVAENLQRTGLQATLVEADVLDLGMTDVFDAVLLDAPCSATGTIRRHPELPYLKSEAQILELAGLQGRMLRSAAVRVGPGGTLLYCTCSLEAEEGERQVKRFLSANWNFEIVPALSQALPVDAGRPEGWIRTLPGMAFGSAAGMDGFFMAAMRRQA